MEVQEPNREFEVYLEKNIVILLKENRYLYGILKSFDQYNSISLNFTTERIFHKNKFAEKRLGLISLRGENIIFLGIGSPDFRKLKKVDYDTLASEIKLVASKK